MILILLSWIVCFFCFIGFGVATTYFLKFKELNVVFTLLFGMVSQTIFLTICAFFVPISLKVFVLNCIISILFLFYFKKETKFIFNLACVDFKKFNIFFKFFFIIILVSSLLKCAQAPFILDNESYYIQTIKWLNEYGFVKGLGNLNVAFGQTSGWHILQSGFNFSFINNRFNDINGFLLLASCFYFLSVFNDVYTKKKQFHWVGFILIFNILSFQFINSPSPDLPVFLIGQFVFLLFLNKNRTYQDLKIITILFLFLCFVKITIAPIGLLVLYGWVKEKKYLFLGFSTLVFLGLFIFKNIILTGYPLYPFQYFASTFDWKIPNSLLQNINNMIRNHEFLFVENYKNLSIFQKFLIWFDFRGINGIFNKGILFLFLFSSFFVFSKNKSSDLKIVYLVLFIHFVSVFVISPQFRFFLPEFIFLSCLLISEIFNRLKVSFVVVHILILVAVILPIFILFSGNFTALTDNKFNQNEANLSFKQIYLPNENSKFKGVLFKEIQIGNLKLNTPVNIPFFYATGDGNLPCVNLNELNYFKKELKIVPQMRTNNLNDGFYSLKLK